MSGTDWKFHVRKNFAGNQLLTKQVFLWVLSASHKNHAFVPTLNTWRQALKNWESDCLCSSDISWSPVMCVPCSWAELHSPVSKRVTLLLLVRHYLFPLKKIMILWGERDFLSSSEEHGEVREVDKAMQSASRVWLSKHCLHPNATWGQQGVTNSAPCFCLPTLFYKATGGWLHLLPSPTGFGLTLSQMIFELE